MSEENLEIVRSAFAAGNQGDWDGVFADVAPGFQWDNSRAMGADNRGIYSAEGARKFLSGFVELFDSVRLEIDELIPIGDKVVVPHTFHLQGRDGIAVKATTTWLFTIRDEKIESVCLYQEKQEALDAAG
jgi:ketosteroid isomerase-like protein